MNAEIWTVIGVGVALGALILPALRGIRSDVRSDIEGIRSDVARLGERVAALGERVAGIDGFLQGRDFRSEKAE